MVIWMKFKSSPKKKMMPLYQYMDHCHEFKIMSRVIELTSLEFPRLISYGLTLLHKNNSNSIQGSICAYYKVQWGVRYCKNGCTSECPLELLKGLLTLFCPLKLLPLSLKRGNRVSYPRETYHKLHIVSCQSHKTSDFCDTGRCRPIHDGLDLGWVQ